MTDPTVKARVLELFATRPADEFTITDLVNLMRGEDESPEDPELFGEVRAVLKEARAENAITGRVDGGQCFYAAIVDKPGTRQPNSAITKPKAKPETTMPKNNRNAAHAKREKAEAAILDTLIRLPTMVNARSFVVPGVGPSTVNAALQTLLGKKQIVAVGATKSRRWGLKGKYYGVQADTKTKPARKPRKEPEPKAEPAKPKINGHYVRHQPAAVADARFGCFNDGSFFIDTPGCKGTLTPAEVVAMRDFCIRVGTAV